MSGDEIPVVVKLVLIVLTTASFAWIAGEVMRRAHARGTRGRYVWASVERATRYPAILYLLVSAVLNVTVFDDWLMLAFNGVGVALHVALIQEKKRNGEDDDYWTTFKDRLRSFLAGRSFAGAGA